MSRAVNITCPHCGRTFYNLVITHHGAIRCGNPECGKVMNI